MTQQVQLPSIEFDPAVVARRVSCLPGFESAVCLPGWTVRRIGRSAGNGTVGIFHVSGQAATGEGTKPWSLVCKVLDERIEGMGGKFNSPAVELAVYRSGIVHSDGVDSGFRAATCYGIDRRSDGVQYLWIEDLSASPPPPWPDDIYISAARHLGQFNGAWAGRPVPDVDWIATDRWRHGALEEDLLRWHQIRPASQNPLIGELFEPLLVDRIAGMGAQVFAVASAVATLPVGLGHGDCHPKNLFPVLHDGRHRWTVAVDWASVGLQPVGLDCGTMLGSGMTWTELTGSHVLSVERQLFNSYVQGLREAGYKLREQEIRLAHLASLAADYGGRMALYSIRAATDPAFHSWVSNIVGKRASEIVRSWRDSLVAIFPLLEEATEIAELIKRGKA